MKLILSITVLFTATILFTADIQAQIFSSMASFSSLTSRAGHMSHHQFPIKKLKFEVIIYGENGMLFSSYNLPIEDEKKIKHSILNYIINLQKKVDKKKLGWKANLPSSIGTCNEHYTFLTKKYTTANQKVKNNLTQNTFVDTTLEYYFPNCTKEINPSVKISNRREKKVVDDQNRTVPNVYQAHGHTLLY